MSGHPKPASDAPGVSPFPKKHCANCPKFFLQTKPTKRFCSDDCRKEFNRYGSSFGKLKDKLEKMIGKEAAAIVAREFGKYVAGKDFKRAMSAAGFIHRSQMIKRTPEQRPAALLRRLQAQAGLMQNLNQRLTSIENLFSAPTSKEQPERINLSGDYTTEQLRAMGR